MALLLAASVGTAIGVAQFMKEEPTVGNSDATQEQFQDAQGDLIGEEAEKLVVVLGPAGVVRSPVDTPIQFGSREVHRFADHHPKK